LFSFKPASCLLFGQRPSIFLAGARPPLAKIFRLLKQVRMAQGDGTRMCMHGVAAYYTAAASDRVFFDFEYAAVHWDSSSVSVSLPQAT
jgi:hypothetical protein